MCGCEPGLAVRRAFLPDNRRQNRPHTRPQRRARMPDVQPSRNHLFEIAGHSGSYRSAGVGGGITGMGFDLGIIDDPVKNHEQAHSAVIRDKIDEWYSSTFWTRQAPDARILLTMTRWHHDDIAARLLRRLADSPDADQWTVLRLPAIADSSTLGSRVMTSLAPPHPDPLPRSGGEGDRFFPPLPRFGNSVQHVAARQTTAEKGTNSVAVEVLANGERVAEPLTGRAYNEDGCRCGFGGGTTS